MPNNLRNHSILSLDQLAPGDISFLLRLAADLKSAKLAGTEQPRMRGKNIALIFEKDSTRTRASFEVAAYDQGAHVTFLGPSGSHIGRAETIKDTARVLGRIYDAIEFRGFENAAIVDLSDHAGVPVYNGLTNQFHPTQILADLMTMQEVNPHPLSDMTVTFMGDIENNVARSLALGAVKMGMDMRLCGPVELTPAADYLDHLEKLATQSGAKLTVTHDIKQGVDGADFIYTDVWLSMGESPDLWGKRIEMLNPYQVNSACMALSGKANTKFMHCLPSFHNTDTEEGKVIKKSFGLDAMEVTDAVFESPASIVFDQAENRMHSIKAILVATIGT